MLSCGITMNQSLAEKFLRGHKRNWSAVLHLQSKKQNIVTGIVYQVKFNVGVAVPGLFQERRSDRTEANTRHGAVLK